MNDDRTAANPDFRRQIGSDLNAAAMRLNMLVENILDMSRIESGYLSLNLQYYEIEELFGIILSEIPVEQRARISTHLSPDLPMIKMDINWFKQAIINIVHNALQYTPTECAIDLYTQKDPSAIKIFISDNGPGIPESSLSKIFDKFYRVPGSRSGGTGLGLTISKAIVEAHSGQIFVKNKSEGGLCFTIEINTTDHGNDKKQNSDY